MVAKLVAFLVCLEPNSALGFAGASGVTGTDKVGCFGGDADRVAAGWGGGVPEFISVWCSFISGWNLSARASKLCLSIALSTSSCGTPSIDVRCGNKGPFERGSGL